MNARAAVLGALALLAAPGAAAGPPAWVATTPRVERARFVERVPIRFEIDKVFLEVVVAGKARRFVLDTGSPTLLDAALAREAGLEIVDRVVSTDAHGRKVENGVAILPALGLGDLVIHDVPVLVHDLAATTGGCLADGILGSEVLPLGNWRIDVETGTLAVASDLADLGVAPDAAVADLHLFDYPFTPYLEMRFENGMISKAMLDTGSPEVFAICPPEVASLERGRAFRKRPRRVGHGSIGESLGGRAPEGDLVGVTLERLDAGTAAFGPVRATMRHDAPSLLGAAVLRSHVVTLAYPERRVYFERRSGRSPERATYGFGPAFGGGRATVAFVWEDSPAWRAGLRTGDRLTRLDDLDLRAIPAERRCAVVREAVRILDRGDVVAVGFERDGEPRAVRIPRE